MADTDKIITKAGEQSADDPFTFVMSSERKDSDGDIIRQDGWDLKRFKRNPIALFGHNHNNIVGTWSNVRTEGKKLLGELKLAKSGTSRLVDEVRSLVEQKILKTVSVGFAPKEYEPLDKDDPWGGYDLRKNELLECSLVAVPANADAVMKAKALGISEETRKLIFGKAVLGPVGSRGSGVLAKTSAQRNHQARGNKMKLGEKIVAAEEELSALRDEISDLIKGFEDEGRDPTEEESLMIEELEGQVETKTRTIKTLKSAEASMANRTEKRKTTDAALIPAIPAKKEPGGSLLIKSMTVDILAHCLKKSPSEILNERYGHDNRVAPVYNTLKAATTVATTTAVGWAAELVDNDVVGFINELEAVSIYGRMAAGGTAIPFGRANSITVPRRSGNGNVSGSFVGEGASIPVKQDDYGSVTFNRYKAAVITVFTEELARTSTPQVEGLLRDAIRMDTGTMLDSVITDPASAAVAGIRPASPWFGASNQASAGNTQADILTDLRFLLDTLSAANAGRNPRIVMNPARLSGLNMLTNANGAFVFRDELAGGTLMGIPLIVSTNCPATTVFIIDLADFGTAFGSPEYNVSDQVTLAMANDDGVAPTMADTNAVNDAGGSIHISDAAGTTPPTVVRSMYQTWSVALRMVLPISWGMMRTGTAAYVTGVGW